MRKRLLRRLPRWHWIREVLLMVYVARIGLRYGLPLKHLPSVIRCVHVGFQKAKYFASIFPKLCRDIFQRYLESVRASLAGHYTGLVSRTDSPRESEAFLREVEAREINSAQADRFRSEVMVACSIWQREMQTPPPVAVHATLHRCIEGYVSDRLAHA